MYSLRLSASVDIVLKRQTFTQELIEGVKKAIADHVVGVDQGLASLAALIEAQTHAHDDAIYEKYLKTAEMEFKK